MKPIRALLLQASGLLFAGLACAAPQHALTLYNEPPKYPADFKHFDYVNPDAPKGGIFRQAGFGGFDSLNPFISKGVPADDISLIYDTLAKQGLDEPFTLNSTHKCNAHPCMHFVRRLPAQALARA
jgi:microcin C transport system substrate-binding protein